MKKNFDYISPEVEIITFYNTDIITTSGTIDPEEDTSTWG